MRFIRKSKINWQKPSKLLLAGVLASGAWSAALTPQVAKASTPIGPGGVTGAALWLKASDLVEVAAGTNNVTSWTDANGIKFITDSTRNDIKLNESLANFNPTVQFNSDGDAINTGMMLGDDSSSMKVQEVFTVAKHTGNSVVFSTIVPTGVVQQTQSFFGEDGSQTFSIYTSENITPVNPNYQLNGPRARYIDNLRLLAASPQKITAWENGVAGAANGVFSDKLIERKLKLGENSGGGHQFKGHFPELIAFDDNRAALSEVEMNQINSYLAFKYGVTLKADNGSPTDYIASDGTTKMWTANAVYGNRITGIGRDDDSALEQKQSKSADPGANVTIALGNQIAASNAANSSSFASDKSFFTVSDNGANATYTNAASLPANVPGVNMKLMDRVFKVGATNWTDTNITLRLDASARPSRLTYLVVNNDGTFGTGDRYYQMDSNGNVTLSTADLANGQYFTFVSGDLPAPTNVILDVSTKKLSWKNVSGYTNDSDYEYSLDGGTTWTTAIGNPQTLASVPNTVTDAQVRVKEDSTAGRAPGAAGTAALPVMDGNVVISGVAKMGQTLTADLSGITYTPSPSGDVPTYEWFRDGVAITNATESSYTLTADDVGTAIAVKVTADGVHATGNLTSPTANVGQADGPAAPAAPVQVSRTATSITLQAVAGQEYSIDGGLTWQESPTFGGLTPDTDYTFVTRVKATPTQNASAISAGTMIRTTSPASSNADLSGLTVSSGTLSPVFEAGTTNGYTASVANSVSSTTVTATVYDSANASVTASVYNSTGLVSGPIPLTSGAASDSLPLSVGINTIKVAVTAQDGSTQTYSVTVTRAAGSSDSSPPGSPSTGSSGGGSNTTDNPIEFRIIVNGKEYNQIATGSTTKQDGKAVLTATVDTDKLSAQLAEEGDKPVVVVPVATVSVDKVTAVLTGDAIKAMENRQAVLEVQTANGNYKLPAAEIAIDSLSAQLGGQVKLSDIVIHVDIAKSDAAKVNLAESLSEEGKFSVVVPPVDFTVTASYNGKTVIVDKFNAYVEREIPLPDGVDPNKITTATVLTADGTVYHVPTYITVRDGKYYAVANSLTNSTYTLIWHPMTFADVAYHWSKNAVNDMASRLIVYGADGTHYNPNAAITRAEFAAIVVRALGLAENGKASAYSDVKSGDWYVGAVAKAEEYGIITGYKDGTFRPMKTITREEAMAMIARAMKLMGLDTNIGGTDVASALAQFADGAAVDAWAKQAVAATVKNGLVQGREAGLKPMSEITRAETAALTQRMLIKAKLIDSRNSE